MTDSLLSLLQRLQEESAIPLESEEATKQGSILPILSRLGWDRDNVREVVPEYRVENGRVDYCLRLEHRNAVFIEAKRSHEDLDKHQEQLLDYAFREGVALAALTNGVTWWLYLPLLSGSWEQRKFFTIDISQQDPSAVAEHFRSYLKREAVADGSAERRARKLHESRAKERLTAQTLPKAWEQLLQEPDELLAELVAERVESLCGHQPTPDQVAEFLSRAGGESSPLAPRPRGPRSPTRTPPTGAGYTHRRPTAYHFKGRRYEASTWKEVLVGLGEQLAARHPEDFSRVLNLKGRTRDYFSQDYREMTSPAQIPGTSLFVETNLSANDTVKRCRQMLRLFDCEQEDFEVVLA